MSRVDQIFKEMCEDIIECGFSSEGQVVRPKWKDGVSAHTIKRFGVINKYDLSTEFPAMGLRPINLKAAIDELLWIWQKKSNNINDLNSKIWNSWADEDGSIGKAYGYQMAKKDSSGEDQVDAILRQLKESPYSRRMVTSTINQEDNREMGLHPCAWSMTFNVVDGALNAILNQRSQDVLAANAWNVIQYAVLVHMFAQASGLEVGTFIHVIADAHIYDRHVPAIKELISRPATPVTQLWLNPDITNFYDFTVDDVKLVGYEPHEQIKGIPIAI